MICLWVCWFFFLSTNKSVTGALWWIFQLCDHILQLQDFCLVLFYGSISLFNFSFCSCIVFLISFLFFNPCSLVFHSISLWWLSWILCQANYRSPFAVIALLVSSRGLIFAWFFKIYVAWHWCLHLKKHIPLVIFTDWFLCSLIKKYIMSTCLSFCDVNIHWYSMPSRYVNSLRVAKWWPSNSITSFPFISWNIFIMRSFFSTTLCYSAV